MKEHIQKTGVRKYAGDDLIELQAEPLKVIQAFFEKCGDCVINGCEIVAVGNKYDVKPGIVSLRGTDADGARTAKVVPFTGVGNVTLPIYLTLSFTVSERVYGDGKVKPVAYNYTAVASGTRPKEGVPFLEITDTGGKQFIDAIKVTEKLDKAGNGKDVTVSFAEAAARANIASGEKLTGLFGKVAKWFTDLKTVAWTGKYSDLAGVPASLPANGGNADTVGNLNAAQLSPCVKTDVANGFLVKTTIPEAGNAMFVFQLTYNSYGNINAPVSITLQGYNYNVSGTIIETSAISTAQVPGLKLFIKDGLLHLWCDRLGNHTTLAASCQYSRFGTPSTPIPGNAAVEITDAPIPESGITRLVSVVPKVIWHNGNLTDAKDLTVSYAQSPDRVNLVPGETIALAFGKVKKWFTDLKTVAFTGNYADLTNKPRQMQTVTLQGDRDKFYPVAISLSGGYEDIIEISRGMHQDGDRIGSLLAKFSVYQNGWGNWNSKMQLTDYRITSDNYHFIASYKRDNNANSKCVIWLRGGLSYVFTTSNNASITPYYVETNLGTTDYPTIVSPRTTVESVIVNGIIPVVSNDLKPVALTGKYSDLTEAPASLPANGGNADTVDGKHAADFAAIDHVHPNLPTTPGVITSGNLNTYTSPGYYYCDSDAAANTVSNKPLPGSFALLVLKTAGCIQLYSSYKGVNASNLYIRKMYNNAWGGWVKMYSDGDKPTPEEIGAAAASHTHPGTMIAKIIGEVNYAGGIVLGDTDFDCEKSGTSTYSVTYKATIAKSFVMVTGGKGSNGTHTYASLMSKSDSGFVVATADDITGLAAGFHFVVYCIS